MTFLFVFITFDSILGGFLRAWTNPEIEDGGPRWPPFRITQLLRHVTSSPHDADVKGDIFRRTIYPPSLVVIALMFSELRRGCPSPGRRRTKKARSK